MHRAIAWATFHLVMVFAASAQEVGTISGRVLAADGKPIQGAVVTLPDCGPPPIGATTKADGVFSLRIEEGEDRMIHRSSGALRIEAQGYAASYVDDRHITLFPGLDKHLGDIILNAGRRYRGRIVDAKGEPVSGAKVSCGAWRCELGHSVANIGREQQVLTDADGRFHTPLVPLGVPYADVHADGYVIGLYDEKQFQSVGADGLLPDLKLQPDKPIHGAVKDKNGEPIVSADVFAPGVATKTDAHGRFVLRGFGEDAQLQLKTRLEGYAPINWVVTVTRHGLEYYDVEKAPDGDNLDAAAYKKALEAATVRTAKLEIEMQREAHIRGRAIDAGTGMPVTISRIVLCTFTRKKNGEVVLNGCRSPRFAQPKPGEFSVGYSYPTEYHLTISAAGYRDAEAFTPAVTSVQDIDGIEVKMTREGEVTDKPSSLHQRIFGVVKEGEELLSSARIALWHLPRESNAVNANIIRGRTTVGDGYVFASQMLKDGRFSLDVPYQSDDWYLLVETPQRIVAMHGPISVAKGENKSVVVTTRSGGEVRGRVANRPSVNAPLWAVLFSDVGIQHETRVRQDGSFVFTDVYPGEYGLKVGCDSILDSEVPDTSDKQMPIEAQLEIYRKPSLPWKRATRLTVQEGKITERLSIAFEP